MSACLPVSLHAYQSISVFIRFITMFVCLSVCVCVCQSVGRSVCLSAYLYVYLSVCRFGFWLSTILFLPPLPHSPRFLLHLIYYVLSIAGSFFFRALLQGRPSHEGNEAEIFIIPILGGEFGILGETHFL